MNESKLYIVATPIGNLEDMTFRAIKTLKEVPFIIAEDTRHSKILFKKYEIENKCHSFHAQSSDTKAVELCKKIKEQGSAAYISDAGTPGISDPGFKLIKKAIEDEIKIIPIPGPSAFQTLLSASGFPIDKFTFDGFIPHKKGRETFVKSLLESSTSHIFYESVHRFPRLLTQLETHLGPDRKICVGRELTKLHEEIFRGTISEAQNNFTKENTRGEFVILIGPSKF